ncbi:ABC transporter ATP-binding protein [Sphaerochaeta sp. PS]|uniref:ABC transporter ATP-binding protein n=1 Tax=Sphaerochaeta sp. PS TaxID=3076336 RepID=UPI0028A57525|nr:ABC transporter ATP-binding protein [Sphaerochaeta sp. PS]MDT4762893.1 ABC transporter ATP-binding protein [Sphaerochaeta sp. PS]
MIEFKQVSKSYSSGKPKAVDNLNLSIASGQIFGFLGPNGAGKSTTIKMLVGLLSPDSGTITIDGKEMGNESLAIKRLIGYVSDEPLFYEKMTGSRHLDFISDLFAVSSAERRAKIGELALLFEMDKALHDEISSYSHGMKQKLGLMAALLHPSKLLILDEPMVGLDPKAAFLLKRAMRDYADKGNTVFFSTHGMEVAQDTCDRIGIIRKGSLLFEGTVQALAQSRGNNSETLEQLFLELTEGTVL